MNIKYITTLFFSVTALGVFSLSSLSAAAAVASSVNIESKPSGVARLTNVRVVEDSGKYYVTGNVNRSSRQQFVPLGHVDLKVIDSEGKVVFESESNYQPKSVFKQNKRASVFVIELPNQPQEGSHIEVAYSQGTLN